MEEEKWKDIDGFPNYQVSDHGRVRNKKRDRLMVPKPSKFGYMHISLYQNPNNRKNKYVHRLVAEAFCDRDREGLEVNHIDGNKANNSANNLEWCTRSENTSHAFATGLKQPVDHPFARPVEIVETGEMFDSARKCVNAIHGDRKSLHNCLKGTQQTHKGYHFRYVDVGDANGC